MVAPEETQNFISVDVKRGNETFELSFPATMSEAQIKTAIDKQFPYQPEFEHKTSDTTLLDTAAQVPIDILRGATGSVIDMASKAIGGGVKMFGDRVTELSESHKSAWQVMNDREHAFEFGNEFASLVALGDRKFGFIDESIKTAGQKVLDFSESLKKVAGIKRPEGVVEGFAYDVGGAFGSVAASVGLALMGQSPLAIGTMWALVSQGSTYEEALAAGKSPEEARAIARTNAAFQGAISGAGIKYFQTKLDNMPLLMRSLIRTANEVTEEVLQQASESVLLNWKGVRKETKEEILKQIGYTAVLATIAASPVSAAYTYLEERGTTAALKASGLSDEDTQKVTEQIVDKVQRAHLDDTNKLIETASEEVINSPGATKVRQQILDQNMDQFYGKPTALPAQQYDEVTGQQYVDINAYTEMEKALPEEYQRITGEQAPVQLELKAKSAEIIAKAIEPLSTRMRAIAPDVYAVVKRSIYDTRKRIDESLIRIDPFLKDIAKLPKKVKAQLGLAMANSDLGVVDNILKATGISEKNIQAIRSLMADFFNAGVEQKMFKAEDKRANYFPRALRYDRIDAAMEYFAKVAGESADFFTRQFDRIENSLRKKGELGEDQVLSPEHRAQILQNWLMGLKPQDTDIAFDTLTSMHQRVMQTLTAEAYEQFFKPTDEAIIGYIYEMSEQIEMRKVFGSEGETIPRIIDDMLNAGTISQKNVKLVKQLLGAYYQRRGVSGPLKYYRDIEYMMLLGHLGPVLTQMQDVMWTAYDFGLPEAINTFFEVASGKHKIDAETLGLAHNTEELLSREGLNKYVRDMFKLVGLTKFDIVSKETYANAYYKKLSRMSLDELTKEADTFFRNPETSKKVFDEIQQGIVSDDLAALVYFQMSERFPLDAMEQSEWANLSGNMKIMYMLKGYSLKALDNLRKEVFSKIGSSDPKIYREGQRNLWRLAMLSVVFGVPTYALKKLVSGKELSWDDFPGFVLESVLNLTMFNRFLLQTAAEDPGSIAAKIIAPPMATLGLIIGLGSETIKSTNKALNILLGGDEKTRNEVSNRIAKLAERLPVYGDLQRFYNNASPRLREYIKRVQDELAGEEPKIKPEKIAQPKEAGLIAVASGYVTRKIKEANE